MATHFIPPEYIRLTAEYTNAVLMAILPHISDYCHKLNLPIETPVMIQQVARFDCSLDKNDPGGGVILTNGYIFGFGHGIVDTFVDQDHCFRMLENPSRRSLFYGISKMNDNEAVEFARKALTDLGYSIIDASADVDPFLLRQPIKYGTNVVPYYMIKWRDPRGVPSVDFEIDASRRRVTALQIFCSSLWKDSLDIAIQSQTLAGADGRVVASRSSVLKDRVKIHTYDSSGDHEVATESLAVILSAVSDCVSRIGVPISLPITTNQVDEFNVKLHRIWLTNGYEFAFLNGYVCDFKAPDTFFVGPLKPHMQRYWGDWNMKDGEVVKLAREMLSNLGYWKKPYFFEKEPDNLSKAVKIGNHTIPRCVITWTHVVSKSKDDEDATIDASASVEVDAGTKTVKSFHVLTSDPPNPVFNSTQQ